MNQLFFIIFTLIIVILIGVIIFIFLKKGQGKEKDDRAILILQEQLKELRGTIQQYSQSSHTIIKEITQELTKVGEGQKQVVDIAKQLENLQDILKNPKQRGVLGEYYLKTVLENVLPPGTFQMQYEFKDGTIVDAVIFIKDRLIPIDSKFSLENYNRILETKNEDEHKRLEDNLRQDLKIRIDETSKYIKPSEGTMEFSFMFIPSEALYYDLLVNKVGSVNARDLIEYAIIDKKVIIVSPTSFMAYLRTVLQGLKALQIEESAKEIRRRVIELGRHLSSYETYMKKLGMHLGTSINMYNQAYRELGKIDKDVLRITGEAIGTEPQLLDKPDDI
ncbi:MAG: DNA recombination protein RmuC [Patescibacteria group bacterium]